MSKPTILPEQINLTADDSKSSQYDFYDSSLNSIHKAIEIDKVNKKIKVYPFYYDSNTKNITLKKIEFIEFDGWTTLTDIPKDFKRKYGSNIFYDFQSVRAKRILKYVQLNFKSAQKLIISLHGKTSFTSDTIIFNWPELEHYLKQIDGIKSRTSRYVKYNDVLTFHQLNSSLPKPTLSLLPNEFHWFVGQFTSLDKFSKNDVQAISDLIGDLPASKITVTQNFIQTQAKINIAFLDNIIKDFEKLRNVTSDNEKDWQVFFEKNSWLFNHLFPFEVILKQKEAYVGGKTLSNVDGKVVDFLLDNGFKDNFALIEIKTHKKDLLKPSPYRGTDVFAMTDDLSGGISQALDQKHIFMTDFGQKASILDPKCILVIGWKSRLSSEQRKCFELIRANQKNIDIVTFDELEEKLKGLLKVISLPTT